ncbi:MAG: CPBP family glutamic-type intramembrane protease, partial [Candidatus Rokuibacteriota bacterium]
ATAVERPPVPARLGVEVVDRDGHAEVTQVVAGSAADGTLRAGDRITAVAHKPLDVSRPAQDLRARLRDEGQVPKGETVFTVVRAGATEELTVRLPRMPRGPALRGADLPRILLRALAVLLLVGALLLTDGQSAYHIGLARDGFLREALLGVPVLLGTLAVHLSVTIPIALALSRTDFASREASQRVVALGGLAGDVSLWQFALSMVVVAVFEEGLFRGFLLPRVRHLTGRWALAVALVPLLFGLGHLYEGVLAVAQAAVLGLCFSIAFLWRGHLASAVVAHAAFNTLMFTLLVALQRSGFLEKMTQGP